MPKGGYRNGRDELSQAILAQVRENGPMTRGELCAALNRDRNKCAAVVSRLATKQKTLPKRLYIIDYVYEDDTNGRYFPRARYALGDKRNASRPKPDHRAAVQRYRERQKLKVASIFDLGLTRRERATKRQQTLGAGCTSGRGPLQEAQDSANGVQHGEQLGRVPAHSN